MRSLLLIILIIGLVITFYAPTTASTTHTVDCYRVIEVNGKLWIQNVCNPKLVVDICETDDFCNHDALQQIVDTLNQGHECIYGTTSEVKRSSR